MMKYLLLGLSVLLIGCSSTPTSPSSSRTGENSRPLHLKQTGTVTLQESQSGYIPIVPLAPELKRDAEKAQENFDQAINLMQAGRYLEAQSLLEILTEKHPKLSGPWLNLGLIKIQEKDWEAAKEYLITATQANPQNTYAFASLGLTLRELGRFEDAKIAYLKALSIDQKYAKAQLNLGILADLYLNDLPLALKHYKIYQALQQTPDKAVKGWIKDLQRRIDKMNKQA